MHTCKNCANAHEGKYCNLCGERILEQRERSLIYFFGKVINAITFADVKFLRTFWLTLRQPGKLSKYYVEGVRVRFFAPLSLFMLANLLYFLIPTFNTFNSSFDVQTTNLPYKEVAASMAEAKIADIGAERGNFIAEYDIRSTNYAKLLIVLFVMIFAGFLTIIYFRKNRFYTDHLTVSLEFVSLLLFLGVMGIYLLIILMTWIVNLLGHPTGFLYDQDVVVLFIIMMSILTFYHIGRNFYNEKRVLAILKAVLVIPALYYSIMLYRFSLFIITLYSI